MLDVMADALAIVITCILIAAVATGFVIFRPAARRRRRRKRHSARNRIDLFAPAPADTAAPPDA